MKNTCPKCGTAYNVSASVIGRKFTCKNCSTPVVVTADGLDYQNPPTASAPAATAPVASAGGAFDFDAGGGEPEPASKPAKVAKTSKRPARDEEPEEDEDDLDSLPKRSPKKRAGQRNLVTDFLFFREFIAPVFVKLIFFLAILLIIGSGLVAVVIGLIQGSIGVILGAVGYLVIGVPLGMFLARVYCELILLGFAAYDRLGEIKALLEKNEK